MVTLHINDHDNTLDGSGKLNAKLIPNKAANCKVQESPIEQTKQLTCSEDLL